MAASASSTTVPPKDLSHHFSKATKLRAASNLKAFYKYFQIPNIGNLAGGLPNYQFFPYDTLEAQVAKPERWMPTPNHPVDDDALSERLSTTQLSSPDAQAAFHISIPKLSTLPDLTKKIDLSTALQYGLAEGFTPLRSFIRQFARDVLHDVPYEGGAETLLTVGSTDGFSKSAELLIDPWFPDTDDIKNRPAMLCEKFAYPAPLSQVAPKGVQIVPVEIDGEGMRVDGKGGLKDVLENWDHSKGKLPKMMYTVTMGHNPTSGVLSPQRRRDIYALCSKYDIIIIEDDPYWYMQFPSAAGEEARVRGSLYPRAAEVHKRAKSSGYDFIDSLTPSYLSFDVDGRVIRLDTFSKTVAPGCRLGWITAQPAFIERLTRITEAVTQQPSGFVQGMVAELIMGQQPASVTNTFRSLTRREQATFSGWNMDGWVRWLAGLRGQYERRMNAMCKILDDGSFQLKQSTPVRGSDAEWGVITKTRLISFDWPRGGMFIWMRVHLEDHPLYQQRGDTVPVFDGQALQTGLFILCTHEPYKVLGAPGTMFGATPELSQAQGWRYMRLCFAAESDDKIEPSARSLTAAVQKFWKIKNKAEMEELINEFSLDRIEELSEREDMHRIGYGMGMGC